MERKLTRDNFAGMMNRLREQMATMLSTRIGQGAGFFPWSSKIPEGANTTSTTKVI